MEHLHAGHGSTSSTFERASASLYWPNFSTDLINFRAACPQCFIYTPSNPAIPPTAPEEPGYPFQSTYADFFSQGRHNYLVVIDRYSNWLNIFKLSINNTDKTITIICQHITMLGILVTLTTDGAKLFTAK